MTEKLRMPEIQPPLYPSDNFTLEEAMAALEKVEAEERARRKARRQRARARVSAERGEDP